MMDFYNPKLFDYKMELFNYVDWFGYIMSFTAVPFLIYVVPIIFVLSMNFLIKDLIGDEHVNAHYMKARYCLIPASTLIIIPIQLSVFFYFMLTQYRIIKNESNNLFSVVVSKK